MESKTLDAIEWMLLVGGQYGRYVKSILALLFG
jgi:hypothetical protein